MNSHQKKTHTARESREYIHGSSGTYVAGVSVKTLRPCSSHHPKESPGVLHRSTTSTKDTCWGLVRPLAWFKPLTASCTAAGSDSSGDGVLFKRTATDPYSVIPNFTGTVGRRSEGKHVHSGPRHAGDGGRPGERTNRQNRNRHRGRKGGKRHQFHTDNVVPPDALAPQLPRSRQCPACSTPARASLCNKRRRLWQIAASRPRAPRATKSEEHRLNSWYLQLQHTPRMRRPENSVN